MLLINAENNSSCIINELEISVLRQQSFSNLKLNASKCYFSIALCRPATVNINGAFNANSECESRIQITIDGKFSVNNHVNSI